MKFATRFMFFKWSLNVGRQHGEHVALRVEIIADQERKHIRGECTTYVCCDYVSTLVATAVR